MLYVKLTPITMWPKRSELIASIAMCLRTKFGTKITSVIDCFDLYVERLTNLTGNALT